MKGDELKGAKVTVVIETKITRGDGSEKSPVREVTQYWGLNGEFLAEMDSQHLAALEKKEIFPNRRIEEVREDRSEIST